MKRNIIIILVLSSLIFSGFIVYPSEKVEAGSYDGQDLALAILANSSWLVDSSYSDTDTSGNRQSAVLSSLGTMTPTHGSTFAIFSTGIAGTSIVTTGEEEPGDERGSWFEGGKNGYPRDRSTLTMTLQVPDYMHYLYYDVQFFSAEYPEYVGTQYNDKFTITVDSPNSGTSQYYFDVNSGYFVWDSRGIPGTGFDIYARSGYPSNVDMVDTYPRSRGADAGASDLIPIGGEYHPVTPNEEITVTINIEDAGDNLFDSGAFIDNLMFSGFAKTDIIARKTAWLGDSIISEPVECGDIVKYKISISNTGSADQDDNPGNEFEDILPENTTYVLGSAYSQYGNIEYLSGEKKIIWNGQIPGESSRLLEFQVQIDSGLSAGTIVSNQGTVYWDSNEDGNNDAVEFTDNPYTDDGFDLDGDDETNDDDPTNITVVSFDNPPSVTEDFSDDLVGGMASQSYYTRDWFNTTESVLGGGFEVVWSYKYLTDNSFKTKLRKTGSPQFWNYDLAELGASLVSWEVWFACGDACNEYDMLLFFKNSLDQNISKIKFEYEKVVTDSPMDYYLKIYFWDPVTEWNLLESSNPGGYLRNSWYKLRVEKNGDIFINYTLYQDGYGIVDTGMGSQLSASFSDFQRIEWRSTKDPDPVACPMFFWDDHTIGLEYP